MSTVNHRSKNNRNTYETYKLSGCIRTAAHSSYTDRSARCQAARLNSSGAYVGEHGSLDKTGGRRPSSYVRSSFFSTLIVFTAALIIILALLNAYTQPTYGSSSASRTYTCTRYESTLISKGDSLYKLADRLCSSSALNSEHKLRERFINEAIQVNGLSKDGKIYAGGYLLLPVYE